jgi:glycosyltransferase involved in cell wall biosynthesis
VISNGSAAIVEERMGPLFSVIIPTYNRAHKAMRAVQSVLAQTFDDYEIWVIDDGSTDDTRSVLSSLKDGRLNYVCQSNAGVAIARNTGIARARGKYIAFLDSDDRWYPTKLERIAQAIDIRPDIGLFYSRAEYVRETGTKLWTPNIRDVGDNGYRALLEGNFVAISAAVVKKRCFDIVGGFDTPVGCEDWDMWIRISRFFPICMIDDALVIIEHLSSGSRSFSDGSRSFSDGSRSSYQYYVSVLDKVLDKAFRADPQLGMAAKRRIRAAVAYTKGRIYLWVSEDSSALQEFRRSITLNRTNWRALIYLGLLYLPWLRRLLPQSVKRALCLPEA